MRQFNVTGMSCAACSSHVEKAVSKVPGVTSCSVSLLTNSMSVEGAASAREIIRAVEDAGYGASEKGVAAEEDARAADMESLRDTETPRLARRLAASLVFWAALMYLSMGHMMWGWPVPDFLERNPVAMGLAQMLLSAAVMVINQKFFQSGFKGLLHRAPNMDTLVALGAGAAFAYSMYALFAMSDAQARGDMAGAAHYVHEFYFESAATILTLITIGKMLEARSKGKTTDAIKGLMDLSPKTAVVLRGGKEAEVPIGQVRKGDIFLVRPGGNIPVDGVVLEGESAVNEAALTGESIPVDKSPGDMVSAATANQSGFLKCEATRVGEDTTLSQIIRMVSDAAATKAPIAKTADKVSGVFVPVVIGIAAVTAIAWILAGQGVGFALARAISVLVISCPCALGLATPVAIMVGNGVGAKNGILFKTAASLEAAGRIRTVALDKTGTVTYGEPEVTDLIPSGEGTEEELLEVAYALERKSEHPLAKAIVRHAKERGVAEKEAEGFQAMPGNGLSGLVGGEEAYGGNAQLISGKAVVPDALSERAQALSEEGKTPLYFAKGGKAIGIIAVADRIKEDSPRAIQELREMGLRVVMLTGDNRRTADAIGRQAGVDEVIADVLPDGKESVIRSLQQEGKTAMVGDGINDAPALTRADVGIAIGAGTDIAIDAADVVLMKSNLCEVPAAIRLSRAVLRNIRENLFWAFFYNIIGIPLAAGVWIPLFGWKLNPMFAAAAMSLSSFCVVTNALRLNFAKIHGRAGEKEQAPRQENEQAPRPEKKSVPLEERRSEVSQNHHEMEEKEMGQITEKTMKIEGMMCAHCEATVKQSLEGISGVAEAAVSHEAGTAIVKLDAEVPDEALRKAVEEKDYKVLSIA